MKFDLWWNDNRLEILEDFYNPAGMSEDSFKLQLRRAFVAGMGEIEIKCSENKKKGDGNSLVFTEIKIEIAEIKENLSEIKRIIDPKKEK